MKRKVMGLKRKLLMPLAFSLAVAPALNTGSNLTEKYIKERAEIHLSRSMKDLERKVESNSLDFYSLAPEYLSKRSLEESIENYQKLIPEEFDLEDIKKIVEIESSFNKNAYREDYRKRKINGEFKIDTIRQGGILQVTERTYNSFEKDVPYSEGVFNPEKNLEVGLKNLNLIKDYNVKFNPYWNNSSLEDKQKYLIAGHNWGIGSLRKNDWDLSKVPKITSNFFDKFYSRE